MLRQAKLGTEEGGRVARSDLERKAEQVHDQIEDLRANLDDVLRNYNKLMASAADWVASTQGQVSRAARQAKGSMEEAGEELAHAGIPWWVPVAVVGAVGIAIAIANLLGVFAPNEAEHAHEDYTHNLAGPTPPYGMPGQP